MRRAAILLLLLALVAPIGATGVAASPIEQPNPQASPCVVAATAALSKRGSPYVWGAKGPSSFDCSGIVYWAWKQAGFDIGVSTYNQAVAGTRISCDLGDLAGASTTCWAPGDLIFLAYSGGQHVAIYTGNGLFMDCYSPSTGCILHNVANDSFYQAHFWQARRIVMNCAGAVTPGTSDPLPDLQPGIETIPSILPLVYFETPQCGICSANGADPFPAQPEPQISYTDPLSPFTWLAWRLGEYLRILLCFLLYLLALLAGLLQSVINAVVGGINELWRLGVYVWLQTKAAVVSFWLLLSDIYGVLSGGGGGFGLDGLIAIGEFFNQLYRFILDAFYLVGLLLLQLGQLILIPIQIAGWITSLILSILWEVTLSVLYGTTQPVQLGGTHPIYQGVRGALEGLIASQAGWIVYLLFGMCYIAFVFWASRFFKASTVD